MTTTRAAGLLLVAASMTGLYLAVRVEGAGRAAGSLLCLVAAVAGVVTLLESRRATEDLTAARPRPGRHRL